MNGPATYIAAACLLLVSVGCLEAWNLEERRFPCRVATDCVEGYRCDANEFVCVPEGDAVEDAGFGRPDAAAPGRDAGDPDTGEPQPDADVPPDGGENGPQIGEPCQDECREGFCVDGFCCESECSGTCERCDFEPGMCQPITDGEDPDDECQDAQYDCASLTFGIREQRCWTCASEPTKFGTCDGARACRPAECECNEPGPDPVSSCGSALCLVENACPRLDPINRWDELDELCALGGSCGDAIAGCCSASGRCCPAPMCSDDDPLCR